MGMCHTVQAFSISIRTQALDSKIGSGGNRIIAYLKKRYYGLFDWRFGCKRGADTTLTIQTKLNVTGAFCNYWQITACWLPPKTDMSRQIIRETKTMYCKNTRARFLLLFISYRNVLNGQIYITCNYFVPVFEGHFMTIKI